MALKNVRGAVIAALVLGLSIIAAVAVGTYVLAYYSPYQTCIRGWRATYPDGRGPPEYVCARAIGGT